MFIRSGLLLLTLACMSGCVVVVDGDWDWGGDWVERNQDVADVAGVEFSARGTLYITQGPRRALKMEGDEHALEQLRIDERDGTLIITQAADEYRWFESRGRHSKPIYTLEIANLESIRHRGHGMINVGPFTLEELHIDSGGHAQTYVASINARNVVVSAREHSQVRIETLDSSALALRTDAHADIFIDDASVLDASVDARAHGDIWLAGQTDSLDVSLREHSALDAQNFEASIATVNARDHAQAQLQISTEIHLQERGNATVTVAGDPQFNAAEE